MTDHETYLKGLELRRQVLGDAYVDANLAESDDFMMTFQRLVTEQVWGRAWSGTALDKKTKSLLTLGILAALGRFQEVGIYTNGALACGVTVDEIREALVHVTAYCGAPAGRQAFTAAHEALVAAGALGGRDVPEAGQGFLARTGMWSRHFGFESRTCCLRNRWISRLLAASFCDGSDRRCVRRPAVPVLNGVHGVTGPFGCLRHTQRGNVAGVTTGVSLFGLTPIGWSIAHASLAAHDVGRKAQQEMATRKRHSPEQIVRTLMAADRLLAEGKDTAVVCRELECVGGDLPPVA